MRIHAASVLVALSVYVLHPPPPATHSDYFFLCRTYSTSPSWNNLCCSLIFSRLEHLG